MNIFITGGTGFIGRALCERLAAQGHRLTVLTRQQLADTQAVRFVQHFATDGFFDDFDAVINLAGEPIFAKRWTSAQKQRLRASRIGLTAELVEQMAKSANPPRILISASATGFYGNLPFADFYDEQTACAADFAAQLCADWEAEALKAQAFCRVCLVRTGMVLAAESGALAQMLPLYRYGLGGKLGSGEQYWGWISLEDQLRALCFLLENHRCQGAYNLVSPEPVRNVQFNQALSRALNRPAFCAVPSLALKLVLGERSQLLLDNQPLVPKRLLAAGFQFQHPELAAYLQAIL